MVSGADARFVLGSFVGRGIARASLREGLKWQKAADDAGCGAATVEGLYQKTSGSALVARITQRPAPAAHKGAEWLC